MGGLHASPRRERGAGGEDRFAERDDDEKLAPLGKMAAFDRPVAGFDRPMPGRAKPVIGDTYSHSAAIAHSAMRHSCPASAPAIQNTPEMQSQMRILLKFGASAWSRPSRNST